MAIEALSCSENPNNSDCISRQAAIDALKRKTFRLTFAEEQNCEGHVAWSADAVYSDVMEGALLDLPSAQQDVPDINVGDMVSRQAAIDAIEKYNFNFPEYMERFVTELRDGMKEDLKEDIAELPSAQLGQRYTNEELMIFQHGISLSLLSKRSAQHWHYDEDTATEIKFLERLYEKVGADIRGEEV